MHNFSMYLPSRVDTPFNSPFGIQFSSILQSHTPSPFLIFLLCLSLPSINKSVMIPKYNDHPFGLISYEIFVFMFVFTFLLLLLLNLTVKVLELDMM